MPYSDNRNTISSCSNIIQKKEKKKQPKSTVIHKDDVVSSSSVSVLDASRQTSHGNDGNAVYVSCKAKYNNRNKTLMICKRAS